MFVCPTCKKCFQFRSYYMQHVSILSDCSSFQDVDDLSSKYKKQTRSHMCERCNRTFSSRRGLTLHLKLEKCTEN